MSGMDWSRAKRRSKLARERHGRPMSLVEVPVGATGFRGVHRGKRGKVRAVIEVDGIRRHLGYFTDPMIAAQAYDAAAREAWGSAAVVNFGGDHD